MVRGRQKSGSKRKTFQKVPSGRVNIKYVKKNPNQAGGSEGPLAGTPRKSGIQLKKVNLSKKRPSRPFGGVLSSADMRAKMKKKAREMK